MNVQLRPTSLPLTTQAGEGLVRRRSSVAEIESMVAQGILAEDERLELIGGELIPMSPPCRPMGMRHENLRTELAFHLTRQVPATVRVAAEAQFNLADDAYVVPDILVYPAAKRVHSVRGPDALLVVEIADSSLAYDLNTKSGIYAAYGIVEYWVINAQTLATRVHRTPSQSAYADIAEVPATDRLQPRAVPEIAVALGELELD
jgi:Uma2 family endonuclease